MFERISRKVASSTRTDGFGDSGEVSETGTFEQLRVLELLSGSEATCYGNHSIEQVQAALTILKLLASYSPMRVQKP